MVATERSFCRADAWRGRSLVIFPAVASADYRRPRNGHDLADAAVRLVKHIVHLLGGIVWPDRYMSTDVSHAGSHSCHLPAAGSITAVTAATMTMASGMSGGIYCCGLLQLWTEGGRGLHCSCEVLSQCESHA